MPVRSRQLLVSLLALVTALGLALGLSAPVVAAVPDPVPDRTTSGRREGRGEVRGQGRAAKGDRAGKSDRAGKAATGTTAAAAADDPPDLSKFQKVVLGQGTGLGEVMELTVAPDGRVFFITRAGDISMYDPADGSIEIVMNNPSLGVWSGLEDGGLGITVDPDFADNGWIYVYYAPLPASHNANRLVPPHRRDRRGRRDLHRQGVGEGHPRGRHPAQRLLPLRRLGPVRRRRRAAPRHGRQHLVLRQRRLLPPRRADRALRLRRAEVLGQHQRPARQDPARHPPQRRRRRREPDRRGRHLVRHPRGQPVRRGRRLPVRALPRRRRGEDAARDLRDGPAQPLPARRRRRHRRPLLGRGRPGLARQQPQPRAPPLRGVQPHRGRR